MLFLSVDNRGSWSKAMNNKLIINFTPTGMVPMKSHTPHVPVSPNEIIKDVKQAVNFGITVVHLHARDIDQKPTCSMDIWKEIIGGIRSFAPDLVICVSLSGRNFNEYNMRAAPLTLDGDFKPDMGSLTLSSFNFLKQASVSAPDMIMRLATDMKDRGIVPELEAFDVGMINYAKYLIKKGFLEAPFYMNILVGNIASAQLDHIQMMINWLPKDCIWSLAGIGNSQLAANMIAIATGGGVRVGLEDNIYYDVDRVHLATNFKLIERVSIIGELAGRKVMPPSEFRVLMKMKGGYGQYGR